MGYLGLALFAEGKTDHRYFKPLLQRLCVDLCAKYSNAVMEVGDVFEIHSPAELKNESREIRILEAAKEARDAWDILFIHSDGAGSPERVRKQQVNPACRAIRDELKGHSGRRVAVIPVRETEAWCLADGNALRKAFGSQKSDNELQLPGHARDVEKIYDPKKELDQVYHRSVASNRGGRPRKSASGYLDQIGEFASLEKLCMVPAFYELKVELSQALLELRYIERS